MKKQIIRIARFQAVLLAAAVFVAGCAQIPAKTAERGPRGKSSEGIYTGGILAIAPGAAEHAGNHPLF